ncbi:armadillo repeat only 4 [Hibiscus trionum]|uniref:Armadillo repeat only 4 n=1 Tax=Hibiscus trionum TaxID=183268 RepID=A0A9W7JGD3_HIBTR|nr:armadillo repeat only 4 [Hibiscus trionum]
MRPHQKQIIENVLKELVSQATQVEDAVAQAKLFRVNCRKMGMMVCQLSQMLLTLLRYVSLDPVLLYMNPNHYFSTISMVSRILDQALSLACTCKRKTIFCHLFPAMNRTRFHKLYRLLDACIADTNRLLIIYDPGFNRLLANGSPFPLASWSCMVTAAHSGDELHLHQTLMILTEITTRAECNIDLRCKAFKTNSPGAKAIVELLLNVIQESEVRTSKVLAIRSIGSLARIFRESNNHPVLRVLVSQLENGDGEVVTEALVALTKFACDHNHLCRQHSNMMIELSAAQLLVKLLSEGEREWWVQFHGLELMCRIASKADYSEAVEHDRVATAIRHLLTSESGRRTAVSRHPELKELATKALDCLTLYYPE